MNHGGKIKVERFFWPTMYRSVTMNMHAYKYSIKYVRRSGCPNSGVMRGRGKLSSENVIQENVGPNLQDWKTDRWK